MFGIADADYATLTGRIEISPTLDWGDINVSPYLGADGAIGAGTGYSRSRQLKLNVHEEPVVAVWPMGAPPEEQRQEFHLRRWADAVVPVSPDKSHYATNLVGDLQELVSEFPEHEFAGYIQVHPQVATSGWWRLYVINGQARMVRPRLLWPVGPGPHPVGLTVEQL
jgi:hypothetical protein